MSEPQIKWVKRDSKQHAWFEDGMRCLVALQVRDNKSGKTNWEFDVVVMDCDGEGASLRYEGGEYYDKWNWEDFEYFSLLEGPMPRPIPTSDEDLESIMDAKK